MAAEVCVEVVILFARVFCARAALTVLVKLSKDTEDAALALIRLAFVWGCISTIGIALVDTLEDVKLRRRGELALTGLTFWYDSDGEGLVWERAATRADGCGVTVLVVKGLTCCMDTAAGLDVEVFRASAPRWTVPCWAWLDSCWP